MYPQPVVVSSCYNISNKYTFLYFCITFHLLLCIKRHEKSNEIAIFPDFIQLVVSKSCDDMSRILTPAFRVVSMNIGVFCFKRLNRS